MEVQDPRGAVSHLVSVLRTTTRVVQILPFAYLLVVSVYLLMQSLLPDWAQSIADSVLNVPIFVILVTLGAGHLLKLCAWFRTACLLPLALKTENWFDAFVFTFTQEEVVLINGLLAIAFVVFLYLSYKHFFSCKKTR